MPRIEQKKGRAIKAVPLTNNCRTGESSTIQRYKNYVPLDYIRAELIDFDNSELLRGCEVLDFREPVNRDTSTIEDNQKRTAKYKNLIFQYHPLTDRMFLSGSLHIFWNDGEHNYNDFILSGFLEVLSDLYRCLGITPQNIHLTQVEWGLNITPPIDTNTIIEHCLFHIWKPFEIKIDNAEGKYSQVEHKNYYLLKCYNKGLHYSLNKNLLRFERKQLNWYKYCRKFSIGQTLFDLMQSDFIGLSDTLLTNWKEMLFFDPCIDSEDFKILKFRDPKHWKQILSKSRPTIKKYVDRLRKNNVEFGSNIQGKVLELLDQKIIELNNDVLTLSNSIYKEKTLTPSIQPKIKVCKLTELNISMQREDSFLLSHSGLRYYLKNEPKIFNQIKDEFLTNIWVGENIEIQIRETAHNIRTRFNSINKNERQILLGQNGQFNLFTGFANHIICEHYGLQECKMLH